MFGCLLILARIEGAVLGDVLAHAVGSLDQIVAQVTIARFGHVAVLGFKVARSGARPPQASEFGHGIFCVTEIARASFSRNHFSQLCGCLPTWAHMSCPAYRAYQPQETDCIDQNNPKIGQQIHDALLIQEIHRYYNDA